MNRSRITRTGLLAHCAGRAKWWNGRLARLTCATASAATIVATASAQSRDPFGDSTTGADAGQVTVSDYMTVDLHVQDETLANVLQMLSLQSERNIVMSSTVSASVTADLYNVTFHEALDAILNVNGYGYIEKGNFIYVYTTEEIAQIEKASRVPVSKVITLNYLNANDASEFCTPLLSEIGQIKTNGDVDVFNIPDDDPVGDEQFALSATMVVFDYPEHVEEIVKLVEQLDTKPAQVLVEATILQTALTEANAFGVDFSFLSEVSFTDFLDVGGPLGAANALISGGAGTQGDGFSPPDNNATAGVSNVGNTSGPGGFKLGVIRDDFSVFLKLLDEVSDTTILSNPKILAINRAPARIQVGFNIGFLNTTSTETSSTQTVDFLETGTQLRFRPFISNAGDIRMELYPSVSEGFIRQATDSNGANVTIPDERTQELTTNVIVRDGMTIVLGGLFKETTVVGRRQIPIVGDLPLIGAAFRGHDNNTDRSEIIFMITPTIMKDEILLTQGQGALDELSRVRTGTRKGLLPFSRDRMTSKLNIEAEKLAQAGDVDRALWKLRRSLNLNAVQPEAIHQRDALLGKSENWPARSILDRVLQKKINEKHSQAERSGDDRMSFFSGDAMTPPPSEAPAESAVSADAAAPQQDEELRYVDEFFLSAPSLPPQTDAPSTSLMSVAPQSDTAELVNGLQLTATMTPSESGGLSVPAAASKPFFGATPSEDIPRGGFTQPPLPQSPLSLIFQGHGDVSAPKPANLVTLDTTPILFPRSPSEMTFLIGDGPIPPRYNGMSITSGWRTLQDIFMGADRPIFLPGMESPAVVEVNPDKE